MTIHPGMQRLADIRSFAAGLAAELEPATRARFTGAERTEANPEAVAQRETMLALTTLIDAISADAELLLRMCRVLAR